MPIFICRWQNGDFSAVFAPSRGEAMELLDEVGNGEVSELFTAKNFMVHFRLKGEADDLEELVPVVLDNFGEETLDMLSERVYPIYNSVSGEDLNYNGDVSKDKLNAALKLLNEALTTERLRQLGTKQPELSDDADVAELQKKHDMPTDGREKAVKKRRRRAVAEMPPSSDKVH